MKSKLFNNLLLISLFGIALNFFGILYEGLVYGPKLLDVSMTRMLFWKSFTTVISPIIYYIPMVYIATILIIILYFNTSKEKIVLKSRLKWGTILQIISLALTIYILTQINIKLRFSNLEKYAATIPGQVILFNILSICRILITATALASVFKAYILTQKEHG